MYTLETSDAFDIWLKKLRDMRAKAVILVRLQRIEQHGLFGDCKVVGDGVKELRIDYSKGYRLYFTEKNGKIILLLCGGDKSSQQRDIERATKMLKQIKP